MVVAICLALRVMSLVHDTCHRSCNNNTNTNNSYSQLHCNTFPLGHTSLSQDLWPQYTGQVGCIRWLGLHNVLYISPSLMVDVTKLYPSELGLGPPILSELENYIATPTLCSLDNSTSKFAWETPNWSTRTQLRRNRAQTYGGTSISIACPF